MAETKPLTVRVPKQDLERLNALAQSTQRSKSELASEALAVYLAAQEWQVAAIEEAVAAADAGASAIGHAAVATWLRSWGGPDELPRPR